MPNILPNSFVVCTIGLQVLSHRIHLHLRQLLRHFHSLGLTSRFTPPCQSDQSVLANLLRPWRDLSFLTPIPFPGGVHGRLYAPLGCPYGGLPDFRYLDPFRPQTPYQRFGTQSLIFGLPSLGHSATGPPSYESYGQYHSSVLYPQTGWE